MKTVNQKDIALKAKVARSTVAMVLNGTARKYGISSATIERVLKISDDLAYSKNIFASSLKTRKSNLIGIVGSTSTSSIRQIRQNIIARNLKEAGFDVMLEDLYWTKDPARLITDLTKFMPEGLIICDMDAEKADKALSQLCKKGVPIVFVDIYGNKNHDNISVDREKVGYIATRHLLEQGYKEVYYTLPEQVVSESEQFWNWKIIARYRGFCKARQELLNNKKPENFLIDDDRLEENGNFYQRGYFLGKKLLDKPRKFPLGIVALNDQTAIGMIKAFTEANVNVPRDIGIVGSENLPESEFSSVPLTTIKFPVDVLAKKACELLIHRISDDRWKKRRFLIAPELVARQSSMRKKV